MAGRPAACHAGSINDVLQHQQCRLCTACAYVEMLLHRHSRRVAELHRNCTTGCISAAPSVPLGKPLHPHLPTCEPETPAADPWAAVSEVRTASSRGALVRFRGACACTVARAAAKTTTAPPSEMKVVNDKSGIPEMEPCISNIVHMLRCKLEHYNGRDER
jgi:hypothetical protein